MGLNKYLHTNLSLYGLFFSFSIGAEDKSKAEAEPLLVDINICSGCSKHGTCNYTVTRTVVTPSFKVASCQCEIGYEGNSGSIT